MATTERTASVVWEGNLATGRGSVTMESSGAASDLPVDWPARSQAPEGRTSPEELIAAAHSSCYAMALSNVLSQGGNVPEQLAVSATVALELDPLEITTSVLDVRGRVPGLDDDGFRQATSEANEGCPVSNALRGNVAITVNAALES